MSQHPSQHSGQHLITVIGGSGFVGRYVVRLLAKQGIRVRVAVRHPNRAMFLKPMGDIGQVQIVQANVRNKPSLERAVAGADAVINLTGVLFEAGKNGFSGVHDQGARNVAEAAREAGAKTLVHLSAIGADKRSPSKYARSKAAGEAAVRDAFPEATILRPSVIFGPEDGFFNRFAMLLKMSPMFPLIGGATRFQPVYIGDVAAAILAALETDGDTPGRTYELGGPHVYTFREIIELVMKETRLQRTLVPWPFLFAKIDAFFLQMLPNPLLTIDQVRLLQIDNVADGDEPGLDDLGIPPTPAEAILPTYLWRFRRMGQFSEEKSA